MKIKNKLFRRGIPCCLVLALMAMSVITSNTVNAKSLKNADKISYVEKNSTDANFISKDLITDEENYYDLYNNGVEVNVLGNEKTTNSNVEKKESSAYFPNNKISASRIDFSSSKNNFIEPKNIIGSDNRKLVNSSSYPFSAVCSMIITWPDGARSSGTAWLYGKNTAITAGHCIYSADNGGWATSIEISPGANQYSKPFGSVYATNLYTSTEWIESSDWEHDYGVLKLSSNIGTSTGWFGLSTGDTDIIGTDVTITGYPGEYYRQMWTMTGEVVYATDRKVYYNIDTTGGQSGSPIYDSNYKAVGIHAYGGAGIGENSGTRINSGLFDFFNSIKEQ